MKLNLICVKASGLGWSSWICSWKEERLSSAERRQWDQARCSEGVVLTKPKWRGWGVALCVAVYPLPLSILPDQWISLCHPLISSEGGIYHKEEERAAELSTACPPLYVISLRYASPVKNIWITHSRWSPRTSRLTQLRLYSTLKSPHLQVLCGPKIWELARN